MSFMGGRLDVSVGAVEVIDAIQQAEAGGDAVRLAVNIESGIKGRLGDLKLFASLSGVARSESSGKLVGDFGQVDFGGHVDRWLDCFSNVGCGFVLARVIFEKRARLRQSPCGACNLA